jgi:hypothetical protein
MHRRRHCELEKKATGLEPREERPLSPLSPSMLFLQAVSSHQPWLGTQEAELLEARAMPTGAHRASQHLGC